MPITPASHDPTGAKSQTKAGTPGRWPCIGQGPPCQSRHCIVRLPLLLFQVRIPKRGLKCTPPFWPTPPTFSSWHGVCPKLPMMPSKAFLCVSSAMASRSTAPKKQRGRECLSLAEERTNAPVKNWKLLLGSRSPELSCERILKRPCPASVLTASPGIPPYLHMCNNRRHSVPPQLLDLSACTQKSSQSTHGDGQRRTPTPTRDTTQGGV